MIDSIQSQPTNRVQQVECIFEETPYQFQETINKTLKKLGDSVIDIQLSDSLAPGFSCFIIYWGGVETDV